MATAETTNNPYIVRAGSASPAAKDMVEATNPSHFKGIHSASIEGFVPAPTTKYQIQIVPYLVLIDLLSCEDLFVLMLWNF